MLRPDLDAGDATPEGPPIPADRAQGAAVERIAAQFVQGGHGHAAIPTAVSSRLRRMNPGQPGPAMGALMPVLVGAGFEVDRMSPASVRRWALVTHVVAILAGTGGAVVQARAADAGRAIHAAGYAETRMMRLLTARGPALADQMTRLARFLAAKGAVPLDLRPLAELALHEGVPGREARTEAARMTLARGYYGAAARASHDAPDRSAT